jgi:hypothetical protein
VGGHDRQAERDGQVSAGESDVGEGGEGEGALKDVAGADEQQGGEEEAL